MGKLSRFKISKKILEELNLSIGDKVKLLIQDNKIILEPIKKSRKKYDINELVKQIPSDYKPYEEFDNKDGIEEW